MTAARKILAGMLAVALVLNLHGLMGYFAAVELAKALHANADGQAEIINARSEAAPMARPAIDQDIINSDDALNRLAATSDQSRWAHFDILGIRRAGFRLGLAMQLTPKEIRLLSKAADRPEPKVNEERPLAEPMRPVAEVR